MMLRVWWWGGDGGLLPWRGGGGVDTHTLSHTTLSTSNLFQLQYCHTKNYNSTKQ